MSKPASRWLILVPTEFELSYLQQTSEFHSLVDEGCDVSVCGFGPIVSAAKTTQLIAERNPARVVLAGIAGTYTGSHLIGSAYSFVRVSCFGIGVGSGDDYQSATEAGWKQWAATNPDETIEDSLALDTLDANDSNRAGALLTCTTSSSGSADVAQRLAKFPDAVAEDMEGFAVAVACRFAGVPLTIIRGISNAVGDRDKANWKIEEALSAAAQQVASAVRGANAK